MKYLLTITVLFSVFFSACKTTGEISINSDRRQLDTNLTRLEAVIIPLEAAGRNELRSRQNEITSARQMITTMEREAAADADFSGKLMGWSGRLALLEGRYSEAQRLYRQSSALSAGNVPSIILGIKLEGDPSRRLEIIERELAVTGRVSSAPGFGELQIERGSSLFELNRFAESAGSFDAAFSSGIPGIYRDSYISMRNQAWELRNTAGASAGTLNLLGRETISWNDFITLAKNETQLLRFITGGRDLSNTEIFTRLSERAFIPNTQNIALNEWPAARPRIDETVTRSGAAWLIWRLYAEARADRSLLTRYSTCYATGPNPRSPVADVPPLSPFFDSILGCVETEFISLPDGRNFRPEQPIRAAELLTILRRIDN